jgi:hypothetical protein
MEVLHLPKGLLFEQDDLVSQIEWPLLGLHADAEKKEALHTQAGMPIHPVSQVGMLTNDARIHHDRLRL